MSPFIYLPNMPRNVVILILLPYIQVDLSTGLACLREVEQAAACGMTFKAYADDVHNEILFFL